jgi:tRNA-binding protein
MATIEDFERIDLRVGRIVDVQDLAGARSPAYRLSIDCGEAGTFQSSARLTKLYTREDLLNRLVICVVNLPPRLIAGFRSEVLVLGVPDDAGGVVLLQPERDVVPGVRVF